MEKKMFHGADNLIFQKAKELRNNQTLPEIILWEYLRQKPHGIKFRRQHPISIYIADFYCHSLKLIIEIDGEMHNDPDVHKKDLERQTYLQSKGIFFLRFTNDEIMRHSESVINKIENYILSTKKPL